jgi:DNA replication licensing factor MCM7
LFARGALARHSTDIVDEYVRMRQESLQEGATFGFTSARTLLAILRLSQALARLRCATEVNRDDIVEARRLMTLSRSSVTEAARGRDDDGDGRKKDDPISIVYQVTLTLTLTLTLVLALTHDPLSITIW